MGPKLDQPAPRRLNSRSRREPTCSRRSYRPCSSRIFPLEGRACTGWPHRARFRQCRPCRCRRCRPCRRFRPSRSAGSSHRAARTPQRTRTCTGCPRRWDRRAAEALPRTVRSRPPRTPRSVPARNTVQSSTSLQQRTASPRCTPAAARYPRPIPQPLLPHPNHRRRLHRRRLHRRRPCLPHRLFHRCSKRRRSTAASNSRRCRAPRCIQPRADRRGESRPRAR
jgi:hypothetical protein